MLMHANACQLKLMHMFKFRQPVCQLHCITSSEPVTYSSSMASRAASFKYCSCYRQ